MNPLSTLLKKFRDLPARQQAVIIGGTIALILAAFVLFKLATGTSWATAVTGLEPKDAPKATQALDEAGIENRIDQGGTAIQVPEEQLDEARATLATSNVGSSGSSQVGFEMFDKNNLGATDFQQKIQYQRALEGEIARTIQQIDGVDSAQVRLVLPKDQLFTDEGNPASASVVLQSGGAGLQANQVQGMARLVQTAVEGIKPENITITDQTGGMLWPTPKVADPDGQNASDQQSAEDRYNATLAARLNSLLVQTLGPNKAQASVSVDLDLNKTNIEKLKYGPKEGPVLTEKTNAEQLKGRGTGAGTAGTDGNIPTYGAASGGSGNTDYNKDEQEKAYGVDKEVTKTQVAPGAVQKLQVAVLLDREVPAADEAALRQTLSAAAGIDAERGDQIAISRVTFTKPAPAPAPSFMASDLGSMIRWGVLGVGMLLFLFFTWRALRKREKHTLEMDPVWLSELEEHHTLGPMSTASTDDLMPERSKMLAQTQVEQLADRDPEQMALQIRSWMNEE